MHIDLMQYNSLQDVKNLAIVFGSVIFGEDEMPKGGAELLTMQSYQVCVLRSFYLLEHS